MTIELNRKQHLQQIESDADCIFVYRQGGFSSDTTPAEQALSNANDNQPYPVRVGDVLPTEFVKSIATPTLSGNILTISYVDVNDNTQTVDVDLSSISVGGGINDINRLILSGNTLSIEFIDRDGITQVSTGIQLEATQTQAGLIQIATAQDAREGEDNTKAMTPLLTADAIGSAIAPATTVVRYNPNLDNIDEFFGVSTGIDAISTWTTRELISAQSVGTYPAELRGEHVVVTQIVTGIITFQIIYGCSMPESVIHSFVRCGSGTSLPLTWTDWESTTFNLEQGSNITISDDGIISVVTASETEAGVIRIATEGEARLGGLGTIAITPATLVDAIRNGDAFTASTSRRGVVELATTAETELGTDSTRAVTPAGVQAAIAAGGGSGGTGGSSTFRGLTDTPATYGTAGQVPVVNPTADGLVFADAPTGGGGTSTPGLPGDDGEDGASSLRVFSKQSINVIPDTPDATGYNNETGVLSNLTPDWSQTYPETLNAQLDEVRWAAEVSVSPTGTIVFGSPYLLRGEDGERGLPGAGANIAFVDGEAITTSRSGDNVTISAEFATANNPGVAEIADNAETDAGNDNQRMVTPFQLQRKVDALDLTGGTAPDPTPIDFLSANATSQANIASIGLDTRGFGGIGTGGDTDDKEARKFIHFQSNEQNDRIKFNGNLVNNFTHLQGGGFTIEVVADYGPLTGQTGFAEHGIVELDIETEVDGAFKVEGLIGKDSFLKNSTGGQVTAESSFNYDEGHDVRIGIKSINAQVRMTAARVKITPEYAAVGEGVAKGGTAGQVLAKKTATDFDTEWVNQSGGSGGSGASTSLTTNTVASNFNLDSLRTDEGYKLYSYQQSSPRLPGTYPPGWGIPIIVEEHVLRHFSGTNRARRQIVSGCSGGNRATFIYERCQVDDTGGGSWGTWTVRNVGDLATHESRIDTLEASGGSGGTDASTTTKGIVELATNSETQAGTDSTRAVTPASLNAKTATTSRRGVAEIATTAEADGGTDNTRIMTAALVKRRIDAAPGGQSLTAGSGIDISGNQIVLENAANNNVGGVRLATDTEAQQGNLSSNTAVTPRGVRLAIAALAPTGGGGANVSAGDGIDVNNGVVSAERASESNYGSVRFAGVNDVAAGNGDGVIRASHLDVRTASTSRSGLVELATTSEADSGTSTSRVMTPALVKRRIDASLIRRLFESGGSNSSQASSVSGYIGTGNSFTSQQNVLFGTFPTNDYVERLANGDIRIKRNFIGRIDFNVEVA